MHVIRVTKSGTLANARPCSYCIMMMRRAGIKICVYTNDDGDLVKERVLEMSIEDTCSMYPCHKQDKIT